MSDTNDREFLRAVVLKPHDAVTALDFMRVWEIANRAQPSTGGAPSRLSNAELSNLFKHYCVNTPPRGITEEEFILAARELLASVPSAIAPLAEVSGGLPPADLLKSQLAEWFAAYDDGRWDADDVLINVANLLKVPPPAILAGASTDGKGAAHG